MKSRTQSPLLRSRDMIIGDRSRTSQPARKSRRNKMDIKISTEQARVPVTILQVDGDIDYSTYDEFLSQAQSLIREGARHMLIDLASAPYVSSAGLRAIYTIFMDLRDVHPEENLNEEQMEKAAV